MPPLHLSAIPSRPFAETTNRAEFKVAIIDNDPFPHTSELRRHGFVVTELGDIVDFSSVAEYPIVACDIKGVGKSFGASHEGAHVIAELRRRYPSIYLIGYSGGSFGPEFKKYWDCCDVFLRRDVGLEQWVESIHTGVIEFCDPVRQWKRIRAVMLSADMPTFEVYLIEQAYIKSIIKKDTFLLTKEIEKVKKHSSAGETLGLIADGLRIVAQLAIKLNS